MLKQLKFVMGAVAKKGIVAGMEHFAIGGGQIRSYDGELALAAPLEIGVEAKPNAKQFIKAVKACSDNHPVVITMITPSKMFLKNGPFETHIDCLDEETPHVEPEGTDVSIDGEAFLKGFDTLRQFVGNDASREWTNGILLHAKSAFATNNVIIAQLWLGVDIPVSINVPCRAIDTVLGIGEPPTRMQIHERSLSVHFADGSWLRTKLYDIFQADLEAMLGAIPFEPAPVPAGFFDGLRAVEAGMDLKKSSAIYFQDGYIRSHLDADQGSRYKLENFPHSGAYNIKMLMLLEGNCDQIDFTNYPKPCMFTCGMLRGAVMPMRMPGANDAGSTSS